MPLTPHDALADYTEELGVIRVLSLQERLHQTPKNLARISTHGTCILFMLCSNAVLNSVCWM